MTGGRTARRDAAYALGRRVERVAAAVGVVVGLLHAVGAGAMPALAAPLVAAEDLQRAMGVLVDRIGAAQSADGSWSAGGPMNLRAWSVGQTALAVLALCSTDVPADDPVVARGISHLLTHEPRTVCEASLRVLALEGADRNRYRAEIQRDTQFLIRAQQDSGGWSYRDTVQRPDNSNSQFALLALRSAALCGVAIPEDVWTKAWGYFASGQQRDGGWSYLQGEGDSYGSMTAAGVSSLYICASRLHVLRGQCGQYVDDRRVEAGLAWLADRFTVVENPAHRLYKFYYLYGLERAAVISARRYLGRHDWYLEGVQHLVGSPTALDGEADMGMPLVRDCFALLFLARGNCPVLVHKAQWKGQWNPFRYDVEFLVEHFGSLLGQRVSWQMVPLDAPLDHLRAAPVLYVSGRGTFFLTAAELERLRQYMEGGGFVFVEANGGDEAFDRTFRQLLAEQFPDLTLTILPGDHPVYSAYFDLPAEVRSPLAAAGGPCSMSLLYAPGGLACAWDMADHAHPDFKLGINVLAHATGMEKLEGKLQQWEKPVTALPEPQADLRGAFAVGQLMHEGDWRPHPHV